MSDPVSNAEVEDVLASIRRLVSEEKRPVTTAKPNLGAETGTLVLTQALRVMEPVKTPQAILTLEDADRVPEHAESEADVVFVDQDERAAENARLAAKLVSEMNAQQDMARDEFPERRTSYSAGLSAEVPVPGLSALVPISEAFVPSQDAGRNGDDAQTEDSAQPDDPFANDTTLAPDISLSAKIAALEAAVGKREDDWEPDGVAEEEPYSGTQAPALAWDENTEEEADAALDVPHRDTVEEPVFRHDPNVTALRIEQHQAAVGPDAASDTVGADLLETAAQLDEEALRDMVAEIVREELQGALGERITRNVRKLVRREIQRALAAHDLA